MPIYEYSCRKCGEVIERIQKFSDPPLRRHPGCGGTLTKLISQSAFQLKGSGWYVTDYARSSPPDKAGSEGANGNGASDNTEKTEKSKKKDKGTKEEKAAPSGKSDASA